jgi:hypothetical protein
LIVLKGAELTLAFSPRKFEAHAVAHQVIGYTNLSMILEA